MIGPTSENTLYRGQDDDGTCKQTFDAECVHDLQSMATQFALDQTLNENGFIRANLSDDSLPQVCKNIGKSILDNFPSHCQAFLNSTAQVVASGKSHLSYGEDSLRS